MLCGWEEKREKEKEGWKRFSLDYAHTKKIHIFETQNCILFVRSVVCLCFFLFRFGFFEEWRRCVRVPFALSVYGLTCVSLCIILRAFRLTTTHSLSLFLLFFSLNFGWAVNVHIHKLILPIQISPGELNAFYDFTTSSVRLLNQVKAIAKRKFRSICCFFHFGNLNIENNFVFLVYSNWYSN